MPLSSDLISQFVKITQDKPVKNKESTLYGTVTVNGAERYVTFDGSEEKTPYNTNVVVHDKDRVLVRLKNHEATIVGNMTVKGGEVKQTIDGQSKVVEVSKVISGYISADDLVAVRADIDSLKSANVEIQNTLTANYITASEIESTYFTADYLSAKVADLGYLKVTNLDSEVANLKYIKTTDLDAEVADLGYLKAGDIEAEQADITNLKSRVADINTLMFENAAGATIHTSFSNAVIAQVGDAKIKSAMIESIDTSKVTIASGDDSLRISGNLIQFKDGNDVKMQLGKDAQGKYSVVLCDENGATLLDKDGIKANAVPNQLIVNDMVSDNAAINGKKLDIDSVISEINDGTKTIKSSKVYLDDGSQTLEAKFTSLTTELNGKITSQGTLITEIQGQISSKVWKQDFESDITKLSTQYSEIEQTVDNISITIASHTTEISKKADSTTVTNVSDRVSSVEQNVNSFKATVSSTYATKSEVDGIRIGGRNFIPGSKDLNGTDSTNYNSKLVLDNGFTAFKCTGDWHGVSYDAKNLILNSKVGDSFTYSVNIKTSDTCKLSFYAMCHTTDGTRVYPEYTTGQFNSKSIVTTNSEEQDQRACVTFSVTQGWVDLINDGGTVKWTLQVYDGASSDNPAYLYAPKLERGDKATDWTPAPEDTENDINSISTRVSNNETSITQLSDRITTNVTETTNLGTRMTTVEQTATELTARVTTAETDSINAAKTATNYLNFSSNGLVIGDLTSSTLGKNVLIDSDSVDIRNGETILASFGAKEIILGQNASDSIINLCNGAGTIRALTSEASTSYPEYDSIEIASQEINTLSQRFVTDVTNKYGLTTTPTIQNDAQIYMLSNRSDAGSYARMGAICTTTSTGAKMSTGVSSGAEDTYTNTHTMIYAYDSTDTYNRSNQVYVRPHKTTFSKPLYRNIDGHEYSIFDESMDTGWIDVTSLGSDFVVYSSDSSSTVQYRRRGKIVEIRGAVKPTSAIPGSATNYTIFTLPSGYRPSGQVTVLSQGSGTFNWLLSINSAGAVRFSRYSNGSEYVNTSTSSWLPISAIFLID